MKLSQIAAKPQLISIVIDDEDTVKEFGEPIEFWTWDRQPMETFLKLASIDGDNQQIAVATVTDLILDETGKKILSNGLTIPTKVMMKVITKVVETLGK
jgi:hypothetical protein